jgi:hypothetical protein
VLRKIPEGMVCMKTLTIKEVKTEKKEKEKP